MKRMRPASIIIALLIILAPSLRAGNDKASPAESLPERWEYYPSAEGRVISIDDNWWKNFNDELLDTLVQRGLRANYDLKVAARNISISLNTYKATRSNYFPSLSVQAGWDKERMSGLTYGVPSPATKRRYWTGEVGVSWQIDLFGKITSQAKSKKNLWQASQAEWAATMLSVASQIITEYIDLRVAQMQLDIMQRHAQSQLDVVEMVLARKYAGVASMLDVAQAKTVYYSTLANIPGLENTIAGCINAIAQLLGIYPDQLPDAIHDMPSELPQYQQFVETGIPVDLLRRRPDIVEMEKNVASYAALLGVAKKDFLPTLTLEGTISTSATDFDKLFTRQSFGYTIAPTLSWNLPTGGELTYNVRVARENLDNELDNYNLTVLTAVEETNNALSGYYTAMKHIGLIDDVTVWAAKSLELSVDLYRSGLSAFSNVVDAQETLLEYDTEAVTARGSALTSLVQIYVALGGGWDADRIK